MARNSSVSARPAGTHRSQPGFEAKRLNVLRLNDNKQDMAMPVMSGTESTVAIRAHEAATRRHPCHIIALTAHASAEDRRDCLESGMNAFMCVIVFTRGRAQCMPGWRRLLTQPAGRAHALSFSVFQHAPQDQAHHHPGSSASARRCYARLMR